MIERGGRFGESLCFRRAFSLQPVECTALDFVGPGVVASKLTGRATDRNFAVFNVVAVASTAVSSKFMEVASVLETAVDSHVHAVAEV